MADWKFFRRHIEGSGDIVSEERIVDSFQRIKSSGSFDIEVKVGEEQTVTVWFDDNLIEYVITEVRRGTLEIRTERSYSSYDGCRIQITVESLEEVSLSGSGNIYVENLAGDEFVCTVSGSGDLTAEGEVNELEIKVSGSGEVDARDLKAREAYVRVSGSGDVDVWATESLTGRVSGSGDITYYGNPEDVSTRVSGSGDIRGR
ncbi:MAG: DUF2807 domain-containing protein [Candidatus Zixiibacteriota bacterium]|nr:MAG: DUF2807 domain-containing protein [candidate division Zixibacteria bacterium]